MAKKNLGRFLALTAVSAAVAAGVSYFLKYRSFHAELDEDFHDFEGDDDSFDGSLPHEGEQAQRNYVPLGEKKEESPAKEAAEAVKDAVSQAADAAAEKAGDMVSHAAEEVKEAAEAVKEQVSDAAGQMKEAAGGMTTTIEEDTSLA